MKALKKLHKPPKKVIIGLIVVVAVIVVAAVVVPRLVAKKTAGTTTEATYVNATAEKRDVTVELTGSGTLEAADSYTVTSLVEGEILTADFEEGDVVEEGQLLYNIDSSDASSSVEKAELSVQSAQKSYDRLLEDQDELTPSAGVAGTVTDVAVKTGDEVKEGDTLAVVENQAMMELEVPFNSDDAAGISVGDAASVTVDGSLETLSGTVSEVSGLDQYGTGNMVTRTVTILVSNPGGLTTSHTGTAVVNGAACSGSGSFDYEAEKTVTAGVSGTVEAIYVSEGEQVNASETLLKLTSTTLEDQIDSAARSLREAEISLSNTNDNMDEYNITAPISGTIIDKSYKSGEKVESGKTLCTIYDLSYLTMTLSIDELDISQLEVGQEVSITADAVEGKTYTGVVTKVSVAGTTSNSVTTYPVTVRIDEIDGLLPGMNVDASIVVESATDVVAVPVGAVARGNMVLVQGAEATEIDGRTVESPVEGFNYVSVTVGVTDGDYIEITSGIEEGQTVTYLQAATSTENTETQNNLMGGGMMGGSGSGAPSGGGPGGGGAPGMQ